MVKATALKQDGNRPGTFRRLLRALGTALQWLLPWRWPALIRARRKTQLAADLASLLESSDPNAPNPFDVLETAGSVPTQTSHGGQVWPEGRLRVAERLWGEGETLPSTNDFVNTYLPLMALSEKKSIAILGAGMGGLNVRLVEGTGVWISGYEADKELAALGAERMTMKAISRKAPIKQNDMEALQLKPKSLDGVVSLESLFTVEHKEDLLRTVAESLRVDGEFFYIDYVLAEAAPPPPEVAAWFKNEPHQPHLWTADNTQAFLVSLGLDVRPHQDMTADYRRQVLLGWTGFLANITRDELLDMADDVLNECAFWATRIAALDSGALRVYKFNAFKVP